MFLEDVVDTAGAVEESKITWNDIWAKIVDWMTSTGIKVVVSLLVMFIAFRIINFFAKRVYKRLQKKKVDETIARVTHNIIRISLKIIVLVCLIGYVGIETASISAVIASIGVGVSLAVQGTLANFAGGVIIIIMRPFKIGDYITSNGQSGTVEDIMLFYTHITTPDNKVVYIPNGALANNVIVNVSVKEDRRCDVKMSISYASDVNKAKEIVRSVCAANDLIFKTPAPFVEIGEYGDSSINLFIRVWCKNKDYWTVNFYLLDEIRKQFEENDIVIPFNQLDVTIKSEEKKN